MTAKVSSKTERVLVLGASPKKDRYSYQAFEMLKDYHHTVVLFNPFYKVIDDHKCFNSLKDINKPIDTITMYVGAAKSDVLIDDMLALKPKRVIFNPGAENENISKILKENNIEVINACTLVMLRTGQFL